MATWLGSFVVSLSEEVVALAVLTAGLGVVGCC